MFVSMTVAVILAGVCSCGDGGETFVANTAVVR